MTQHHDVAEVIPHRVGNRALIEASPIDVGSPKFKNIHVVGVPSPLERTTVSLANAIRTWNVSHRRAELDTVSVPGGTFVDESEWPSLPARHAFQLRPTLGDEVSRL